MSSWALTYLEKRQLIPRFGWKKKFSDDLPTNGGSSRVPPLSVLVPMLPQALKYAVEVHFPWKYRKKCMEPIDVFHPLSVSPIYGVPLGGIGCGTIGRGYRGEFCRSSLLPGRYNYDIDAADQFILTVRKGGKCVYHQVLSVNSEPGKAIQGLKSWNWRMSPKSGEFIGLYPFSWTVYNFPELKLLLLCKQVSPVIPGNYKDSCLPLGVFHWTAFNFDASSDLDVSITMTWRGPRAQKRPPPPKVGNAGTLCAEIGLSRKHKEDEYTLPFEDVDNNLSGCLLETLIDDMPCCYGIAAQSSEVVSISRCLGFTFGLKSADVKQSATGEELLQSPWGVSSYSVDSAHNAISANRLWTDLGLNGTLTSDKIGYYLEGKSKRGQPLIGVAVCASFKVPAATPVTNWGDNDAEFVPGEQTCDFFLTWHMPRVHFRSALVAYRRRYTRWFSEDTVRGAGELLAYAARNVRAWEEAIESWQKPILESSNYPPWYKSALFNEIYYVADGGTVWLDPLPAEDRTVPLTPLINGTSPPTNGNANNEVDSEGDAFSMPLDEVRRRNPQVHIRRPIDYLLSRAQGELPREIPPEELDPLDLDALQHRVAVGRDMGLFGYLEGHEYRMYNTYDVHFNASWTLAKLWPQLEVAMLYDLADLTASEDTTRRRAVFQPPRDNSSTGGGVKSPSVVNRALAVPHDAGDPEDEPWLRVNAYTARPTDEWKDLNSKFVLMTWRDWCLGGKDASLMRYLLPLVVAVMEDSLRRWDKDNDGIIENAMFPDQTYDLWKVGGLSAYVGGLWMAALYASRDMLSHALSEETNPDRRVILASQEKRFAELLAKAKSTYHEKLWTDIGYLYDTNDNRKNPTLMADQLCGHWLLRSCGSPVDAILPDHTVPIVIDSIVNLNWRSVMEGKMGAINGIRRNGKVITSCTQGDEFWVGINYCLASLFILEGMPINGFDLCGATYKTLYEEMGMQYQTPEAYSMGKHYRSPGYMRPLSIWSIQHAVELRQPTYNRVLESEESTAKKKSGK